VQKVLFVLFSHNTFVIEYRQTDR